ncbi:MAG: zinc ribbon domain-containing protein [Candidatus Ozemobacteraceae bacterium]
MDQNPKLCPRCQQANFPVAEFCRHCGEPMFEMGSLSRSSILSRVVGHAVDGLFWCIDELVRWWEIGRLTMEIRALRRHRVEVLKKVDPADGILPGTTPPNPPDAEREELIRLSEEISRLAGRDEFLRKRSWALTPELLLVGIFLIFVGGIFWLRPRTEVLIPASTNVLNAQTSATFFREIPLPDHQVVMTAAWFGSRLYVGGDAGLTVIDPTTGTASAVPGLPQGFFVRHLVEEGSRLLIAGYGGVFSLDITGIQPLYDGAKLPVSLINRIAPMKGGHLLGSLGQGLLHGRNGLGMIILGTQDLTINGFARFDGDLWILHERGLLRGDGTRFSPIVLPVLSGRKLSSLVADAEVLYVGTDEGVIGGYKNAGSWVWTPLASGGPRRVTDMAISSSTLLVLSAEGLFRRQDGQFEKLAEAGQARTIALGPDLLAIAGPGRVSLFRFLSPPGSPASANSGGYSIPVIGTFSSESSSSGAPSAPSSQQRSGSPTPFSPSAAPVIPTAAPVSTTANTNQSGSFLNPGTLPKGLTGPFISALSWDGRRLWVGTANDGLWSYSDNTWTGFSTSNGGLSDNQVVSLETLQGKTFFYSWILGILSLDSGRPVPFLSAKTVQGLLGITGDPVSPLLLFEDGRVKRFLGTDKLEEISRVPEEYFTSVRSIQSIGKNPFVISDQGVLTLEKNDHWGLTRFPDSRPTSVKALLSTTDSTGTVFIALSDGTIFSYTVASKQITRIGLLSDRPQALVFSKILWAASSKGLYQTTGTGLVRISSADNLGIISIQPIPERGIVILATSNGLKSLPIP